MKIPTPKYKPLDFIVFKSSSFNMVAMGMIRYAEYDEYNGWVYKVSSLGEAVMNAIEKEVVEKIN